MSPASTSSNNLKIQLSSPGLLSGIGGLYNIKVTNEAATATTGTLTVTDALPTGLSYLGAVSLPPGWHCSATGGTVTCTSTNAIAADGVDYLFLVVHVSARPGTTITDTVNLTPVGTPASNYTSSVTTKVGAFCLVLGFPRRRPVATGTHGRRWRSGGGGKTSSRGEGWGGIPQPSPGTPHTPPPGRSRDVPARQGRR